MTLVDLVDFFQTGKILGIGVNSGFEDVQKRFGTPDDVGGATRKRQKRSVFKFGPIQIGRDLEEGNYVTFLSYNSPSKLGTVFENELGLFRLADNAFDVGTPLDDFVSAIKRTQASFRKEESFGDIVLVSSEGVLVYASYNSKQECVCIDKFITQ